MYIGIHNDEQDQFANKVNEAQSQYYQSYTPPNTVDEYWAVVDKYWNELLSIILRFAPEFINDPTRPGLLDRTANVATGLKTKRDTQLCSIFNKTWASAPDNGSIHLIPAWPILCDLCSESYLVCQQPLG